jgi:hypothetical protein
LFFSFSTFERVGKVSVVAKGLGLPAVRPRASVYGNLDGIWAANDAVWGEIVARVFQCWRRYNEVSMLLSPSRRVHNRQSLLTEIEKLPAELPPASELSRVD